MALTDLGGRSVGRTHLYRAVTVAVVGGCTALLSAMPAAATTSDQASAATADRVTAAPARLMAAATAGLPTAGGTAACGRISADRAQQRAAVAVQRRDSRLRARTTRQKARKAALLRKDAARVAAATNRLRVDAAACDARWRWPSPNSPRLDQGLRPACYLYAAMQQLNARGAHLTQAVADRVADEVTAQAPSAAWTTEDMTQVALARRGVRVSYQRIPATAEATLAQVQRGPLVVGLTVHRGHV